MLSKLLRLATSNTGRWRGVGPTVLGPRVRDFWLKPSPSGAPREGKLKKRKEQFTVRVGVFPARVSGGIPSWFRVQALNRFLKGSPKSAGNGGRPGAANTGSRRANRFPRGRFPPGFRRQVGRREFEVTHRTEVALDCMTVVVDMVLQSPRLSKLWQP
jgi:hypothetical protein